MKLIRAALILLHFVSTYGHGQGQSEGVDSEDIKIDDDEDGRVLGKAGGKAPKFKKDACQRRVDKLEARLMKLEAALAGTGGEEEKAEEEGEEEDSGSGGSGRLGGIFTSGEGMTLRTYCGCDPNVCTMDVMNRVIDYHSLIGRITWLLGDEAAAEGKQLDSPIDACIQICQHDYPGACDECNPLRSKPANVPWGDLRLPSTCDDFNPSSYNASAPRDERLNYQTWRRCKGCIYVQDGKIDPDYTVSIYPPPNAETITKLAFTMGVDIISPKPLHHEEYGYELSNLWQGDFIFADDGETEPFGTYAESNRLFDYRNIKCCVDNPTKLGEFKCQPDDEDFALLIRGYSLKNNNALWFTSEYRDQLRNWMGVGISTCVSTFNKATSDAIFLDMAKAMANDNGTPWYDYVFDAIAVTLLFIPGVGEVEGAILSGEVIAAEYFTEEALRAGFITEDIDTWTMEALAKGGANVLAPREATKLEEKIKDILSQGGAQELSDLVQQQVDTIKSAPSTINQDVKYYDAMMQMVFSTARKLTNSLSLMSNNNLRVLLGYLLDENSACSLPNVTSLVGYLNHTAHHPTSMRVNYYWNLKDKYGTGDNRYYSDVFLDFNGICKKKEQWYIANWRVAYGWSTGTFDTGKPNSNTKWYRYDCLSTKPDLYDMTKLLNHSIGMNYALKRMKTAFTPGGGCPGPNDWNDLDCYYDQDDWRELFPYDGNKPFCGDGLPCKEQDPKKWANQAYLPGISPSEYCREKGLPRNC